MYYPGSNDCKIIRSEFIGGVVYPFNYTAIRYLPTGKVFDRVEMVDFNGDGLTDVMNLDDNGYQLLESDGFGTMSVTRNLTWPNKKHFINFGDFNGDGKTDMLITGWDAANWTTWQLHQSTGPGFSEYDFSSKFDSKLKQIFVGDINGDGRDDFFAIDKDRDPTSLVTIPMYMSNSDGTYFTYQAGDNAYSLRQWNFYTGDFNGDGRLDYFYTSAHDTWNGYQLYTASTARDNLLKDITDGFGNLTSFTYKPVTDNNVYSRYSNGVYPVSDIEGAFQVVSSLTRPNGKGGTLTTNYQYEGAKIHKRGKGFLGFSKFITMDPQTGVTTSSSYEIEPTKYAVGLKRTETRITKGVYTSKLLSETDYTNALQTYETGVSTYMPASTVSKTYEMTSSSTTGYNQTTTSCTYDSYGNVLTMNQSFQDPATGVAEASVNTTNEYTNNTTNWWLGRLTKATVIKKSTGKPDITRVSQFEYNATSGLLSKEIVEPGNTVVGYYKDYVHDAFGNITSSTTTAGGKSVSLTSVYDTQGRFETETYNAKLQKSSKVVSPYFGAVTSQTDINNFTATTEYDGYGRATKSVDADGSRSIVAYRWCTGDEGGPANAVYYTHSESSEAPPVIQFFDRLGRSVRKAATGFDGTRIFVDTEYDDLGRTLRTSDPYFEGGTQQWPTFYYDELSRVTRKVLADNSEIKITYDGLTTTTQNPLGQTDKRIVNQQGLLVTSTDNNSKSVTYVYNSAGSLIETHDPSGNVVTMEYNLLGNRTKLIDPDLGTITSTYNAFGELVTEVDGKNQTVSMEYDDLGRISKRTENEGITNWAYDTQNKGKGKLTSVTGPNGISQTYDYDDLGRIKRQSETIDGITYDTYTTYDVYSRISQITYPKDPSASTPFSVTNQYNKYGFLEKVINSADGKIYWTAEKMNAKGQLEQFSYGNSLRTNHSYNSLTGLLESIKTAGTDEPWVQNWSYTFNAIGTLTQRKDVKRNLTEDFEYDNLNRLKKTRKNSVDNVTVNYDDLGNITFKSDVGTYAYNTSAGSPHALQSITTNTGSILKTTTQNCYYTSFDKIRGIHQGADSMAFTYGIAYERKRVDVYKNLVLKSQKYYVGSLYEKEKDITTGEIKETHYIFAGGGAIAIYTRSSTGTVANRYLHKDHLGSMQCITDETGKRIQELSYDAWGNRRDVDTWVVYTTTPVGILLARGFTGHEHMDLFDLINMDGRLYDPVIGRFLSPDLIIQNPENLQSLNRYTYCLNNPLSLTDPSGYSWLSNNWRTLVVAAIAITVSLATMGAASSLGATMLVQSIVAGAAGGFAGGFSGAVLSGGSFGDAFKAGAVGGVIGAVSGFLSFASGTVGNSFGAIAERVAKHTFSNAWLNGITGTDMEHGFISGALTGGLSSLGNSAIDAKVDGLGYKVICSAVLGGTIDEIGGGKFANGAITGAYGMLFNEMMHDLKKLKSEYIRNKEQIMANSIVMEALTETTTPGELLSNARRAISDIYGDQNNKEANAVYSKVVSLAKNIKKSIGNGAITDMYIYKTECVLGLLTIKLHFSNSYIAYQIKSRDLQLYYELTDPGKIDNRGGGGGASSIFNNK